MFSRSRNHSLWAVLAVAEDETGVGLDGSAPSTDQAAQLESQGGAGGSGIAAKAWGWLLLIPRRRYEVGGEKVWGGRWADNFIEGTIGTFA